MKPAGAANWGQPISPSFCHAPAAPNSCLRLPPNAPPSPRNYNPAHTDPKPPHERRLTRGKTNKLPDEIISMHLGELDPEDNPQEILGNDWEE